MSADLLTLGIPVAEKLIRTLAVYAFLLVGRSVPFDFKFPD